MATDSISKTKCSCEGGFYCGSCNYNLEFLCEKCWTLKYNKTILRLAKLDIKQKAAELASLGDPFVFWECPLIKKYLNGSIKDLTQKIRTNRNFKQLFSDRLFICSKVV